jgi:hypothetical protein
MFAAASCSPSTVVWIEPVQPFLLVMGCPWLSWPST